MILSGKEIAEKIHGEIKEKVSPLPSSPGLAVVLVGEHPISLTYVKTKQRACKQVGIRSFLHQLPETTREEQLLALISSLNKDPEVDGILVQLPLPSQINAMRILEAVNPRKDVDGFHPLNMGKLMLGLTDGFIPCTPLGIKTLLDRHTISVTGKHVVIVGRSNIVGKPLASLLMQNLPGCNATVTVANSYTKNLAQYTLSADILIVAAGKARLIKQEMVKEGAIVIDVGMHREHSRDSPQGYRLVGDVDFEHVKNKCLAITPVPGGVGPMTVAMLLHNTLLSYRRKESV